MTALGLVLAAVLVLVGLGVRAWRRRTVFVPLRMSEGWRRAHAADPAPDHLR